MKRSSTVRGALLAALIIAFACSPALATEKAPQPEPTGKPTGNVTMEYGQGGLLLSASGGKGAIIFEGRKYVFKVGGLGVGGIGVSTVKAVGEVYNLKRIEDFPGAYFQARMGYAVGDGKGHQWLENTHGVVLKLTGQTKGLHLNLGGDGLMIEMGPIKK